MRLLVRLSPFLLLAGLALHGPVTAEGAYGSALQDSSIVISPVSADGRIPGIKSGSAALLWSFLGTAVPVVTGTLGVYRNDETSNLSAAVLAGGLIIGPSLGHFYSARPGPALVGIGIRTLASTAVAAAAAVALGDDSSANDLTVLGLCGVIAGTASLVWDVASAPHSAHVHNDHVRQGHATFGITPSVGSNGLGLRAAVSF
jgi:hypothetical protein